jgi:hypothetical protein
LLFVYRKCAISFALASPQTNRRKDPALLSTDHTTITA